MKNAFSLFQISFKLFYRELKSPPVMIWISSLFLAALITTLLIASGEIINQNLKVNVGKVLSADLVVSDSNPISDTIKKSLTHSNIKFTETIEFFSMVQSSAQFKLANIKAVSNDYPLRGKITISNGQTTTRLHGPKEGEVWIPSNVVSALGLSLGEKIIIGEASLVYSATLINEPLISQGLNALTPTLLINNNDLIKTNVVQPGSRVNYQLLIIAEKEKLDKLKSDIQLILTNNAKISEPNKTNRIIKTLIENTEKLLSIATMLTVLLSALALTMTTQYYSKEHQRHIGLFKALGVSNTVTTSIFGINLFIISIITLLMGIILAYIVYGVFSITPSIYPALISILLNTLLVIIIGWPIINQFNKLSPVIVLNDRYHLKKSATLFPLFIIFFIFAIAISLYFKQIVLISFILISFIYLSLFIVVTYSLFVSVLKRNIIYFNSTLKVCLRNFINRKDESLLQIIIFTLIFTCFAINEGVRKDILNSWIKALPKDAPNYFVINLSSDNKANFDQLIKENNINHTKTYPIYRAELTHINNIPTNKIRRTLNITKSNHFPNDNQLIAGDSWDKRDENSISVEEKVAQRLNIVIGDTLLFNIDGQTISGQVFNIRSVKWESFNPNFFFIFGEDSLQNFSPVYMTSFYLPKDKSSLINYLINQFPEISIIDLDNILDQTYQLFTKLITALNTLFALLAGLSFCAWISGLCLTLPARKNEQALFRAFGVQAKTIYKINIIEFSIIALFISLFSYLMGTTICWVLSKYIFNLNYIFKFSRFFWHITIVELIFIITAIVFSSVTLKKTPMALLKE